MEFSTNVFSAEAGIAGEGLISGGIGGRARGGFDISADFCHGIDLGLRAEARAQVNAALVLLAPALRGEGEAYARAGVRGQIILDPRIFKRFGLRAGVAAFAEAGVAGRIAVGLDFNAIATQAEQLLDDLPYRLFLIFLHEIRAEGGVWGAAAVSAMARAHLTVDGSLVPRDGMPPGFRFQLGAAAGVKAGAGFGCFVGTSFDNVRRFYVRSTDLMVAELRRGLANALPREMSPALELFDVALPIALESAFELGRRAAEGGIGSASDAAAPFVDTVGRQLQRWLLDKVVTVGAEELAEFLQQQLIARLAEQGISESERTALRVEVEGVLDRLQRPTLVPEDLTAVVGHCIAMLDILGGAAADVAPVRRSLAVLWTAAGLGFAVRDMLPGWQGTLSGNLFTLGDTGTAGDAVLPDPPALVRDDYSAVLGRAVVNVGIQDAIDYLIESGVSPLLERRLPAARRVIAELSTALDTTPGELVASILQLGAGGSVADTASYQRWRDWLRQTIEGPLLDQLVPAARAAAPDALAPDVRRYLDEAAVPSLRLLSDFLFAQLDRVLDGRPVDLGFLDQLVTGASVVSYRILARNLVTFNAIVTKHVLVHLNQGFAGLEQRFRDTPNDPLVTLTMGVTAQSLPGMPALGEQHRPAVQALLIELAAAGREAFGPTVWTTARQETLRQRTLDALLSIDGEVDYEGDGDALRDKLTQLASCLYIPNLDACEALTRVQLEILGDEMAIMLQRVTPALAEFYLRITVEEVVALERQVQQHIAGLVAAVEAIARLVNDLLTEARALHEEARRELDRAEALLEDIETQLADASHRQAIRDRLRQQGIDNVRAANAGMPDEVTAGAVFAFLVAFDNPVTQAALDIALASIGGVAGALESTLDGVATVDDAVIRLSDALTEAATEALPGADLVAGILAAADVASAITSTLLTGYLRGQLEHWLAAIDAAQAARADEQRKRQQAEAEQARLAERQHHLDDARLSGPVTIRVLSPVAMGETLEAGWVYPADVPLTVVLSGAVRAAFVQDGPGRRVRLALNGKPLHVASGDWRMDDARAELVLETTLRSAVHSLEHGVNVLEVTVAAARGASHRAAVSFVVNPDQPAITGPLAVRPDLSRFNAPSDDHRRVDEEWVTFAWEGDTPLPLRGWRLQDYANRHQYRFPDITVPPRSTVRVVTGGDPARNTADALHMGRTRAVWNNAGDAVFLVDDRNVLRASYAYGTVRKDGDR